MPARQNRTNKINSL